MGEKQKVSEYFGLDKSQFELDFVDVYVDGDKRLFLDPYALSKRKDDWSIKASNEVVEFFQLVVSSINTEPNLAKRMLNNLSEPNETHLGFSSDVSMGKGVSGKQAQDLYKKLSKSKAVQTGFVKDLSDCELMIEGIGNDKISDMTINIIRKHLIEYTQEQCMYHNIPTQEMPSGKIWNAEEKMWTNDYVQLPVANGKKIILIPKRIVVWSPFLSAGEYYNKDIMEYLQAEHINASSSLVHLLKDGKTPRVYKKVLKEQEEYKYSKDFIYRFSNSHPELLESYKKRKENKEKYNPDTFFADKEEVALEQAIAEELISKLKQIDTGTEKANEYHNYCMGALEFIFYPNLTMPIKEEQIQNGRKRIDITYRNSSDKGFFNHIHTAPEIKSNLVMVECKNYSSDCENPELDQLAGRFAPLRGKFGMLLSRKFDKMDVFIERCKFTALEDKGVIVPIVDEDIIYMLNLIAKGCRSTIDDYMFRLFRKIIS